MRPMNDCIFCKISSGKMDVSFLFEDEKCVVFRDINPKAKTHLLIVPKKHITSVADLDESDAGLVGHLFTCARKAAEKLDLKGYNLQVNVGKDGGQEVFHLHVHLLSKF